MSKKMLGKTLALTAALTFAALPATSAMAAEMHGVKCMGGNSCKGKSICKTAHNSCKGKNSCKNHGIVMKKSAKACKKAHGTVVEK